MRMLLGLVAVVMMSCSGSGKPAPTGGGSGTDTPPPVVVVDAGVVAATPCEGEQPSPDHVCMQDCGPPVVRQGDPPPAWHWLSPDEVDARNRGGCPRCLPPDARIATPGGDAALAELTVGDRVLTLDLDGNRIEARVLAIESRTARVGHTMVRTTLADGRVIMASAEHPVADGRLLGVLRTGDALGDGVIVSVEVVPYDGDRTWDLVVSGPTGLYLADGVALRSTLTYASP
jgi:hypothetical protein